MLINFNEPVNHTVIADDDDYCRFCADEIVEEKHIPRAEAAQKCMGKVEGQKVFIMPNYRGDRYVICKDHMQKVWEELSK